MHSARLHKTSRRDAMARDEIYWAETETYIAPRPRRNLRRIGPRLIRDRYVEDFVRDETLVRLETVSRPRRLDRDHIPDCGASGCFRFDVCPRSIGKLHSSVCYE